MVLYRDRVRGRSIQIDDQVVAILREDHFGNIAIQNFDGVVIAIRIRDLIVTTYVSVGVIVRATLQHIIASITNEDIVAKTADQGVPSRIFRLVSEVGPIVTVERVESIQIVVAIATIERIGTIPTVERIVSIFSVKNIVTFLAPDKIVAITRIN